MSEFVVTIDHVKYDISTDHFQKVILDNSKYKIEITQLSEHTFKVNLNNKVFHITTHELENNKYSFLVDGHYFESNVKTKLEEKVSLLLANSDQNDSSLKIKSPMPGLIVKLYKKVGAKVKIGDPVILLEAMKMENDILSPSDGIISEIRINKGSSVDKDQILAIIN